jgi:hypothetical protein
MSRETQPKPKLVRYEDLWLVRVEQPNGKVQEYRCTSESQAKQLAMVLAPSEA